MSSDNEQPKRTEKRRVEKSANEGGNLYKKREELLQEMQENPENRSIPLREQMRTLEAAAAGEAPSEDDWGQKKSRGRSNLWMLWVVVGIAIPVLLVGLILFVSSRNNGSERGSASGGLNFDVLDIGSREQPEDWFVENSGPSLERGTEILTKLSEDELTNEGLQGLVRNEEQIERIISRQKEGRWPAFDLTEPSGIAWQYGSTGETGFMALIGPRSDFSTYRAYFVRNESGLTFDVDATEGLSEVPIPELANANIQTSVLTRAWVAKEPHFDARSDPDKYSWYQILTPDLIDFVWAYVPADGELDELLKTELNYGRVIGERKREFRATIRLAPSGVEKFNRDEFLIEEIVTADWVLPNE